MKALKASISRALSIGAKLNLADNSGARIARFIALIGGKGVRKRRHEAAVGDLVCVDILDGAPDLKAKIVNAVIIRQRKPYLRPDGSRIRFEDNACVIVKSLEGDPKGTVVKGPVSREAVERFSKIGKISSIVV